MKLRSLAFLIFFLVSCHWHETVSVDLGQGSEDPGAGTCEVASHLPAAYAGDFRLLDSAGTPVDGTHPVPVNDFDGDEWRTKAYVGDVRLLTSDGALVTNLNPLPVTGFGPAASIEVGNPVLLGDPSAILFEDGSENLATDADFTYTDTTNTLSVPGPVVVAVNGGADFAYTANDTGTGGAYYLAKSGSDQTEFFQGPPGGTEKLGGIASINTAAIMETLTSKRLVFAVNTAEVWQVTAGAPGGKLSNRTGVGATVSAAIDALSVATGEPAAMFQAVASATAPVLLVKGGATPGAGGNLASFQKSDSTVLMALLKQTSRGVWQGATSAELWSPAENGSGNAARIVADDSSGALLAFGNQILTADGNNINLSVGKSVIITAGRFQQKQGASVTSISSNVLTLGFGGSYFEETASTQINLIDATSWQDGSIVTIHFTNATPPLIKNNQATSGANTKILLAGNADVTCATACIIQFVLGTDNGTRAWRQVGTTSIVN